MAKKSKKVAARQGKGKAKRDPMLTVRNPLQLTAGLNVRQPPTRPWLKLAHGHLNPFLSDQVGLKVPDSNSSESFTYRTVGRYMYAADGTNRYGGFTFAPSLQQEYANWTTPSVVGGAWVNPYFSANGAYSNIIGASSAIRIVSWGVRLFCTCSYDKCNGQVIIATKRGCSGAGGAPATAPTNAQVLDPNSFVHWEVVALKDLDHIWVSEKLSKEGAEAYYDATSLGVSTIPDMQWTNLVVFFLPNVGETTIPPAGAAIGFEVVKNLECLPNTGSISNGLATPAATHDPRVSQLVNMVQAKTPPVMRREAHGPTILSSLYDGVKALALDTIGWAMPHVGRGLGRMLTARTATPAIMDVD